MNAKKRFSTGISTFLFLVFSFSLAQAQVSNTQYYGADFTNEYNSKQLSSEQIKAQLYDIISRGHRSLGYDNAKEVIFGKLFLEQLSNGEYAVKDVYCLKTYTDADFGGKPTLGPGMVPKSGNILNTEHTWPQSRFTTKFSKEMQKSDLHHLYPTDSMMNNRRSNLRFGDVTKDMENLACSTVKLGTSKDNIGPVFEAPMVHKGNVARSILYFALRYKMQISPQEEATLRQWNKLDPIDDEEQKRNDSIAQEQGNRNPFIDIPDLIDQLGSFNSRGLQ